MNIDTLIEWGTTVLEEMPSNKQILNLKKEDKEKLKSKLDWVKGYQESIDEWSQVIRIVKTVENFVRNNYLETDSVEKLNIELNKLDINLGDKALKVKQELMDFVKHESSKAKSGECLLGSSEIIESLFGKQKYLEGEQSKSGFTGLILSIGAFVSETTAEFIKEAMVNTKTKEVYGWVSNKLGKTVQSFRSSFWNSREQNQHQSTAT